MWAGSESQARGEMDAGRGQQRRGPHLPGFQQAGLAERPLLILPDVACTAKQGWVGCGAVHSQPGSRVGREVLSPPPSFLASLSLPPCMLTPEGHRWDTLGVWKFSMGWFCCQGTCGHVWRHIGVSGWTGCYWHPVGGGEACLSAPAHARDSPPPQRRASWPLRWWCRG